MQNTWSQPTETNRSSGFALEIGASGAMSKCMMLSSATCV